MHDQRFLELSANYLGEYAKKIRGSVEGLSEDEVWWRPNDASNSAGASRPASARTLAGALRVGRVPTLADFRQARSDLSSSLG